MLLAIASLSVSCTGGPAGESAPLSIEWLIRTMARSDGRTPECCYDMV